MTSPAADGTAASVSYAAEVARLLWPSPWSEPALTRSRVGRSRVGRSGRPPVLTREAYVFPSTRNPRLLVPADLPGAATMVQRLGNDRSFLVGPMRTALQRSVRSPLFSLARWPRVQMSAFEPEVDSIETYLTAVLGTEVRVGVVLGPRRVNQKPVLQVFGLDGALLGFAKVGHNALTASLVRHEASALKSVGTLAPQHFRAPRLLHAGTWSGLDVLVMSPLAIDPRTTVGTAVRDAAMLELATLGGVHTSTLADSGFWSRLRSAAGQLGGTTHGASLLRAATSIEAEDGSTRLAFGAWHGDWGPWNMGMQDGQLQLWDWERHDAAVPLGFDGVHRVTQDIRARHGDEATQERELLLAVPSALDVFDVDTSLHDLIMRLYLLEIAVRYTDALQHGARPDFVRRTAWVVELLSRLVAHPHTTAQEGRP